MARLLEWIVDYVWLLLVGAAGVAGIVALMALFVRLVQRWVIPLAG